MFPTPVDTEFASTTQGVFRLPTVGARYGQVLHLLPQLPPVPCFPDLILFEKIERFKLEV